MKIYDTIARRTYDILPEDINISKTRRRNDGETIYLHRDGGNMPYRYGYLTTTSKTFKKIYSGHRTQW